MSQSVFEDGVQLNSAASSNSLLHHHVQSLPEPVNNQQHTGPYILSCLNRLQTARENQVVVVVSKQSPIRMRFKSSSYWQISNPQSDGYCQQRATLLRTAPRTCRTHGHLLLTVNGPFSGFCTASLKLPGSRRCYSHLEVFISSQGYLSPSLASLHEEMDGMSTPFLPRCDRKHHAILVGQISDPGDFECRCAGCAMSRINEKFREAKVRTDAYWMRGTRRVRVA